MEKVFRIIVTGQVQFTGYRRFVKSLAESYKLKGTVQNLDDRNVEVIIKCNDEQLETFQSLLKQGNGSAMVQDIFVDEIEDTQKYKDFSILT